MPLKSSRFSSSPRCKQAGTAPSTPRAPHLVQGGGQALHGGGVGLGALQEAAVAPNHLAPAVASDPAGTEERGTRDDKGWVHASPRGMLLRFPGCANLMPHLLACLPRQNSLAAHSCSYSSSMHALAAAMRSAASPQEGVVGIHDWAVLQRGIADADALIQVAAGSAA